MPDAVGQKALSRVALVCCVLFALPAMSLAETFDRGQALYENHCKSCHESWAHAREGREASSVDALRKRVAAWSLHSGLDWSDEDVEDVVAYLNRQFYRFDE